MFPAVSVARTVKVWLPSGVGPRVVGLVQAANVPLSSLHSKPPGVASLALNAKVGVASLEGLGGLVPSVTVGATVSIVQV